MPRAVGTTARYQSNTGFQVAGAHAEEDDQRIRELRGPWPRPTTNFIEQRHG